MPRLLKLPVTRLLFLQYLHYDIKQNINILHNWPFVRINRFPQVWPSYAARLELALVPIKLFPHSKSSCMSMALVIWPNRVLWPFNLLWLTLIQAWLSNYIPWKVRSEISYPFSKVPRYSHWSLVMDELFHTTLHLEYDCYPCCDCIYFMSVNVTDCMYRSDRRQRSSNIEPQIKIQKLYHKHTEFLFTPESVVWQFIINETYIDY